MALPPGTDDDVDTDGNSVQPSPTRPPSTVLTKTEAQMKIAEKTSGGDDPIAGCGRQVRTAIPGRNRVAGDTHTGWPSTRKWCDVLHAAATRKREAGAGSTFPRETDSGYSWLTSKANLWPGLGPRQQNGKGPSGRRDSSNHPRLGAWRGQRVWIKPVLFGGVWSHKPLSLGLVTGTASLRRAV